MVKGTFEIQPPHNIFFGGSVEAEKIRQFVKSAEGLYSVVSVSTSSYYNQTQKFVIQAPNETALQNSIDTIQLYMPDMSIGEITYEYITETLSTFGEGIKNVAEGAGKAGKNILDPVIGSLSLPLIIIGILGIGFIIWQSGYKIKTS